MAIGGVAGEAMAGLGDAAQLLDVQMEHISGGGMFISDHGRGGFEHADAVEFKPDQDAADGGAAESGGLSNADSGPALAAQPGDALDQLRGTLMSCSLCFAR